MKPTERFRRWLDADQPPWRIGQVVITPGYHLRHEDDRAAAASELREIDSLEAWRQLLLTGESGAFRPLRGAPNLRRGWRYGPLDDEGLTLALRYLYPMAVADWAARVEGTLPITEYEETAARQTGRFSVTRTLGAERLARSIEEVCVRGCLRRRLWAPADSIPETASTLPLLCPEACNYFISKARERIKGPEREQGD